MPVLIKTATTVIGFLSLNFSDSPPLNQLGNIVAVGSGIGCVLTITLIPALLTYMRLPEFKDDAWTKMALQRLAAWIIRRNREFLYGSIALFVILVPFIPTISLNDNFVQYFGKSFEFRTASDYLEQHLTGIHTITYSIPAGQVEGITEPEYLRRLDAFAAWYRKQPHVANVTTMADVIRRLNKAMNNNDPAFDAIPDSKPMIAQYLMLYELSLPPGKDLSSIIDVSRSESRVTVSLKDVTSKSIIALADAGEHWLKQNAVKQDATATGLSVVYSYLSRRNIDAMMMGTAISVVLVSLLMAAALRSVLHGGISLIVNLAPAAVAFGIWGAFGFEVNLAISVVTSITYGIVTDDTVHTMTKYRWAREVQGLSPVAAAEEVLTYTGGAVILSSIALSAGFALLGFSAFNITATVGLLSALIIALAALAELFVLPGLLISLDRKA
jgi:predicted RND superfamily exporter protein